MRSTGILLTISSTLLLVLMVGCGDETTGPSGGEEGWTLWDGGDLIFAWLLEDSTSTLRLKLTAQTTGWVAVGIEPTQGMNESNLIIGYVSGGSASIRDDFGTGMFTHASDVSLGGSDDIEVISGSEADGETIIEFRIPLDSGDQYDKVLVDGETYDVIFAFGADGADDYTSSHVWTDSAIMILGL